MVINSDVSSNEIADIETQVWSGLHHTERKLDFLDSWSVDCYVSWNAKTINDEFGQYAGFCGPCVGSTDNTDLKYDIAHWCVLLMYLLRYGVLLRDMVLHVERLINLFASAWSVVQAIYMVFWSFCSSFAFQTLVCKSCNYSALPMVRCAEG